MKINKLVMATNNKNKLREVREIFSPLGIEVISQKDAGADTNPEENGSTFSENAYIKAKTLYDVVKLPVIADDSGLCVDFLEGRPSIHSARYAPEGQECEKILEEMKDAPDSQRTAKFVCVIAFIDENGNSEFISGECSGKIGYEKKGLNGFGYDPIFMCGEKSFAEISSDDKNKISHRAKALKGLYELLKERYCD
ncbi:MAG: RdgB/HAM1 family non-canonical purine NTP pyrophosphatase [Oscillospiraceae bacterium]|nr:RdgB/HAM1 family non-canonical purine NTP pyrophosphatase [Oscillospiraceae bacterium]